MANVAELQIKVSATGVQPFAKSLESLGKAAQNYRADIKKVHTTLSEMGNVKLPVLGKDITQIKSLASATTGIKGATTSFTKLTNAIDRMVAQSGGLGEVAKQLRSIKNSVTAMSGVRLNIGGATGGGSSGSRGGMSDQEKLMRQISREGQMASVGYDKAAYLEQRAAMLGVSEAAKPYIAQMRAANKVVGVGVTNTRAYANAMRMVPAQLTDVVTQLAGGQNPFLIMIQQGGQLADVFRMAGVSMTGMFKAVGGTIARLLLTPLAAVAAVVGTLAYSFYKASSETSAFAKVAAIAGSSTGVTVDSLRNAAAQAKSYGVSSSDAAEAVATLASSNVVANKNLGDLAASAVKYSKATGTDLNKVLAEYITLNDTASEKMLTLNKKYNNLTPVVYAQVLALEKEGKQVEAVKLANEELTKAQDKATEETLANMGLIEAAWNKVGRVVSYIWDKILGIGRAMAEMDRLKEVEDRISKITAKIEKMSAAGEKQSEIDAYRGMLAGENNLRDAILARINAQDEENNKKAEAKAANDRLLDAMKKVDALGDKAPSRAEAEAMWQKVLANNVEAGAKWTQNKADVEARRKKYLEGELGLTTQIAKEGKKQSDKEEERKQRQAGILASLKEQIDVAREVNDQLSLGSTDILPKTNEHLTKAAELRAKAATETNKQVKEAMLLEAKQQQILGDLQTQNRTLEKQIKLDKEQQDNAETLRATYGSQLGIIDGKLQKTLEQIRANKMLSDQEKKYLSEIEEQKSALSKGEYLAGISGDPRAAVEASLKRKKFETSLAFDTEIAAVSQSNDGMGDFNLETQLAQQRTDAIRAIEMKAEEDRVVAYQQWLSMQSQGHKTMVAAINSVSSAMGSQITGMINGTTTAKEAMSSLGNTILSTVVNSLVEWGVKEAWLTAMSVSASQTRNAAKTSEGVVVATVEAEKTAIEGAGVATSIGLAATEAAAWITTAWAKLTGAMAFAGPAAPALAVAALAAGGYAAVQLGKSLTSHDNGGVVRPGESAVVGEYGREIITAGSSPVRVTSRKETERMMGVDGSSGGTQVNMKVINNAGVDVQQTVDSEGNIVMVLEKYLPNILAREGSNPKSKLNQAQSSIYAQKRR